MLKAKRLIALVLTLAMVLTMAGFSQTTASAKVKSIKAKKKVTVQVGKKKTVKIKVKTTGKTSKKFTVKVPKKKKKLIKVKKKKGKIIITGRKKGTVKITVRSKANKKKKKVIKVKVTAADAKLSVKQQNPYVLSLAFSKKVSINDSKVKIEGKYTNTGSYKKILRVSSVATSDSKNFTVATTESLPNSGKIKVTVTGVNKKAIVKEIDANSPDYAYTYKRIYKGYVGQEEDEGFDIDDYANKGYGKLNSLSGLPAGLRYIVRDGYVHIRGTYASAGVYTAKALIEDEMGTVNTLEMVFVVGSSDRIVTYAAKPIVYVSNQADGRSASAWVDIYTSGGSGDYDYTVGNRDPLFDDEINQYDEEWYFGSTKNPGTYTGEYTVRDSYNSSLSANGVATVEARGCSLVKGTVSSATGKPVRDADVSARFKSFVEGNYPSSYDYTNEKGEYEFFVANGKYDFMALINEKDAWVLNRSISANTTLNFKLDVYQVQMAASGYDTNAYEWYDDDMGYVGDRSTLFLPAGNYNLTGKDAYPYLRSSFKVSGDMTATAYVK